MCPRVADIGSLTDYVRHIAEKCRGERVLFRGQPDGKPLLPRMGWLPLDSDPLEFERKLEDEIEWQSPPLVESLPRNPLEWQALVQHHGMRTRLLDWTFSALAALWFMVALTPKGENGAVWAFEYGKDDIMRTRKGIRPGDIDRTCVLLPRHIDRRIAAQAACFTIHAYDKNRKRLIPLDEDPLHENHLTKLIVAGTVFGDMRTQLDRLGVNQATLFPDMDGLCAHLDWLHSQSRGGENAG